MTPAQIVAEVQEYGFQDVSSAEMYIIFNRALNRITNSRAWKFRETLVTLTFDGSSPTPTNSGLYIASVQRLTDPSTGARLYPIRSEDFQRRFADSLSNTGPPFLYYFDAHTLKVYTIPSASYTLTLRYLARQSTLTSSSTEAEILLPSQYHEAIIERMLVYLYLKENDDMEAASFHNNELGQVLSEVATDEWTTFQDDHPDMIEDVYSDDYYWSG